MRLFKISVTAEDIASSSPDSGKLTSSPVVAAVRRLFPLRHPWHIMRTWDNDPLRAWLHSGDVRLVLPCSADAWLRRFHGHRAVAPFSFWGIPLRWKPTRGDNMEFMTLDDEVLGRWFHEDSGIGFGILEEPYNRFMHPGVSFHQLPLVRQHIHDALMEHLLRCEAHEACGGFVVDPGGEDDERKFCAEHMEAA